MAEGNDFKVRSFHSLSSQSLGSVASQPVCSEAECHDHKNHGVDYSVSAQGTEKAENIVKDPESLQSYTSSCHLPPS